MNNLVIYEPKGAAREYAACADHFGLESSSPNHGPMNPSTGSAVAA